VRTTVSLDDDVAAEVERLRRAEGIGLSEAVNRLARTGLSSRSQARPYRHRTVRLGLTMDVTNIGDVLETLDEGDADGG
jgi:metal-responsive CopG/Arc/MetJ family transcriptional regulator